MKPFDIFASLPRWKNASPDEIIFSPAFAAPARLGDEQINIRPCESTPSPDCMLSIGISLAGEPGRLRIAKSNRFPELSRLWDSRAEIPEPLLLALVERECGQFLQMIENVLRRQLVLSGISGAGGDAAQDLFFSAADIVFSLRKSDAIASALGQLRNIDLSHDSIRSEVFRAETEYAAFTLSKTDIESIETGDAILLPEIGSLSPRLVANGRFEIGNGVAPCAKDGLLRIRSVAAQEITLGAIFDEAASPGSAATPPPPPQNTPLKLVQDGRMLATGRLASIGNHPAFAVETIVSNP